ncbi:MAG: ElyC/SanA/YdcF family protein [Planctomycetota bacterium]
MKRPPFLSRILSALLKPTKMKRALLITLGSIVLLTLACNLWIVAATWSRIYDDPDELPYNEVGLLLGTSQYLTDGGLNLHFRNRILAAAQLYAKGRIKHILASGDHYSDANYNEPHAMKEALMKAGVPESAITLDPKGLRTLDSIVRAYRVFGHARFTIISQGYHNARAVFIAMHHDLDVVAFSTEPVPFRHVLKTWFREYFARLKALADLYLLDTQPMFPEGR